MNFYLTQYQITFLNNLAKDGETVSEHVRAAINDYIEKKKREILNVATSSSKGGE